MSDVPWNCHTGNIICIHYLMMKSVTSAFFPFIHLRAEVQTSALDKDYPITLLVILWCFTYCIMSIFATALPSPSDLPHDFSSHSIMASLLDAHSFSPSFIRPFQPPNGATLQATGNQFLESASFRSSKDSMDCKKGDVAVGLNWHQRLSIPTYSVQYHAFFHHISAISSPRSFP